MFNIDRKNQSTIKICLFLAAIETYFFRQLLTKNATSKKKSTIIPQLKIGLLVSSSMTQQILIDWYKCWNDDSVYNSCKAVR